MPSRPSHTTVVAYLALFVALGGTAYAAATIGSGDVINDSLLSEDIKNDTIAGHDIRPSTIGSGRIADGTIIGSDIKQNTIGSLRIADNSVASGDIRDGTVQRADLAPNERWHYVGASGEPAFLNAWENYDTSGNALTATWPYAAFRKDSAGVVHLQGLVTAGTIGQSIFSLPAEYCPWHYQPFGTISNNAFARVTIEWIDEGDCDVIADTGSNEWISLNGISFTEHRFDNQPLP
jgi:hypothetical protein